MNASDPYRDELAYSLAGPPPGMAIDAKTGLITWKPAAAGDYEIVVKARDCKGLCHVQRFIIEVDELPELNRDPVAEAGGPYAAEAGRAIAFDGTASFDPDGDPLSFAWSFGDGTSGSGCCPNHTYGSPGAYQVALTVSDNRGGTATDHAIAAVEACMAPTVILSASPAAVPPGGACTLAWSSGNASLVAIDHGIGTVPASGTITVHPDIDTTYTATATGPCGMAADSVTVTVHRIPSVDITASPPSIIAGQTSLLSWTSAHADAVAIDRGIGAVPATGSLPVSPAETTTYTITASGPGGAASDAVTVTVHQPPLVDIFAQPPVIIEGESSTLTWMSEHATTASLDNGIGQVDGSGSLAVSPAGTTTYTVTVQGPGGTAAASATVTVVPRPDVTISASPNPIDAGQTTLLAWSLGRCRDGGPRPGHRPRGGQRLYRGEPGRDHDVHHCRHGPGGNGHGEP